MIEFVQWDSDFFGYKIGKLNFIGDNEDLSANLLNAKHELYNLVYVFSEKHSLIDFKILELYHGKFVDQKVVYKMEVDNTAEKPIGYEEYNLKVLNDELKLLSFESGKYSRFRLDKNFHENAFFLLYHQWIKKSVEKTISDKVLVVYEEGCIVGMITLKFSGKVAEIGLLSVSPKLQGKGIGKLLLKGSAYEAYLLGCNSLVVPTQIQNEEACKFYEKCGFKQQSLTNIYHFWL